MINQQQFTRNPIPTIPRPFVEKYRPFHELKRFSLVYTGTVYYTLIMELLNRTYTSILRNHFNEGLEMAFIAGPRQVGKTTVARRFSSNAVYLNWDNEEHRRLIIDGPGSVADHIGLQKSPVVIFDEIHKYPHWKIFIKGFYDTFALHTNMRIIVTGSARLDIYRKGGDSLMGRYFLYRMHPLTVAELIAPATPEKVVKNPSQLPDDQWNHLLQFGGFPQPFLRGTQRFYNKWKRSRLAQIFHEDIFDVSRVQEIRMVEILAELIAQQSGQLTSYASLARKIRASEDSIRRWIGILESLYYCFTVRPWHTNIARSLRKEPKYFLWDWSMVSDQGAKNENMIASHLLKAVHYWTDMGLGNFDLFFLRTKDKREIDFLISRDATPWFLVEVKTTNSRLSKNLAYFQQATGAKNAFQVTINEPFSEADCFSVPYPIKVPARTFLSQLV